MHEQILKTMIMHVQEQWRRVIMGMEKNESKTISTVVVVVAPPLSPSSSWLHIHRYPFFRRKLEGTSSVTLPYPHWKRPPSKESCFFSVSPFRRYLPRHQSSCCGTPLLTCVVDLSHPFEHKQLKVCPPLLPPGRPVKGKVIIIICRSRHCISSTHLHYHGHWGIAAILDEHAANATRYRKPNIIIATW